MPTWTALWRHCLRSCWVHRMWQRSTGPDIYSVLPLPENSGWVKMESQYEIDWEAADVIDKIDSIIKFLTKGCSCKKGMLPTSVVGKSLIIVDLAVSVWDALNYLLQSMYKEVKRIVVVLMMKMTMMMQWTMLIVITVKSLKQK